ncbi:hypothetical protein BT69DRAFT_1231285, partial [Atractiella rhizophila]
MPLFDDGSDDLPTLPPTYHDEVLKLTDKQRLALDKFRVWHRGNEKEASYEGHYGNWTSRGHDMHTLPEAKKMLAELSRLDGEWLPMCRASCSAYLGKYEALERCPHSRKINGLVVPCNKPRYSLSFGRSGIPGNASAEKRKTEKSFLFCNPIHRIKAMFRAPQTARMMGDFGRKLGETLAKAEYLTDKLKRGYTYNNFHHGTAVQALAEDDIGFLEDERESVFIASTDGAAIHATRDSNMWFVILSFLGFDMHIRAKRHHTFFTLGVPGPNNPVDIQSF